jgi:hypothetical protein
MKSDTVKKAFLLRIARPEISPRDALGLVRLPQDRLDHLRRHGFFARNEIRSTVRKLRALGEISA